jgi:hypothetical protein
VKLSIFLGILIALLGFALTLAAAPLIGLGHGRDFLLLQLFDREPVFKTVLALAWLLCTYQALSIGITAMPRSAKWRAVLQAAWIEGTTTFTQLSGQPTGSIRNRQWPQVIILAAAFAIVFAVFLSKFLIDFENSSDQVFHQTFVDYDLDWRTPIFSFAGNVLNNFGIQLPLNTELLPILGLSQFFAHDQHIPAAVVLFFVAVALLFWAIGAAWGLPPVSRAVFAGLVALMTTVPRGLAFVFGLPPSFFTTQFEFALWWQEAPILFLMTVVFFYWIGQSKSAVTNILYGIGFALGCFLAVLGYPVGGIYFVPLIALYCLAFFLTSVARAEWMWKGAVCAAVAVAMLAAKVPQFFANLYAYSFGSYFAAFLLRLSAFESFRSTFVVTGRGDGDFRAFLIFIVSMATVAVVAFRGTGALRRFAIAVLVCEAAIITIGSVNALVSGLPMRLDYAEVAHSPLWGAYFVLVCMSIAVVIDRRLATLPAFASGRAALPLRYVIKHRRTIYASALAAVLFVIAILLPPVQGIPYPPAQPPIVKLFEREVAIAPGAPFRGRVLITLGRTFNRLKIRPALGNDLSLDLLPFGIPTVNEFQHWTSPLTFAFLRAFFAQDGDMSGKAGFTLTTYDPKIARLMGVRMVVSDVELFDGVMLHEQRVEDSDLRIYQLDGINLGQFSPTRPVRFFTAAEAVAAMKATSFDPQRDVAVEGELPADLVPADSVSITVEAGPQLHIRATSHGHSLLALPFEFSHCLRLHAPAGTSAYLLPVNLQQTGLIFQGQIEVNIEYRYGLFGDAQCRGADLDRANALRLRELFAQQLKRPV